MIRNTTLHTLAQYCLYTARCAFAALIVVQRCEVIDLVAQSPERGELAAHHICKAVKALLTPYKLQSCG